MADGTLDPSLFAFLKSQLPQLSDADVQKMYSDVSAQVKSSGQDLSTLPPAQQAQIFKSVLGANKGGAQAGGSQGSPAQSGQAPTQDSAPADPNAQAPQQVNVTAKAPPSVDAQIAAMPSAPTAPNPNAGALDALYAGQGPTARRLAVSDPDAVAKAQAALYAAQGGAGGQAANYFSAIVNAAGGNTDQVKAAQERIAANNVGNTTGLLKDQQAAATTGLANANAALTTGTATQVAAQKLDMEKREFITKMGAANLSLEQAQKAWDDVGSKLYSPESTSSVISQRLAEQAMGLPKGSLDGHSAAQIAAEVSGLKPATELQKQYYDQLIAKQNADSSRITAVAGARNANANAGATELGTNIVSNATNGGTTVPAGSNISVSAGPASLTPSPATTGVQGGAADQINGLRKQVSGYDTSGAGQAIDTALNASKGTSGFGTLTLGQKLSALPGGTQAFKSSVTQYYVNQGMKPQDAAAQADELINLRGDVAAQRLAQIKATQGISKATLNAQEKYLQEHGSLAGFNAPYAKAYRNRQTGQVIISDDPKDQIPGGFIPVTQ